LSQKSHRQVTHTPETADKELDRMVLKLYGVDASDLS